MRRKKVNKTVFPPAGGNVTGKAKFYHSETDSAGNVESATINWNLEGTFAGGDGGVVTGTVTGTANVTGYPTVYYSGPWSGNLYASGIGNGVYDATLTAGDKSATGQFKWQVNFSSDEFAAKLAAGSEPVVTVDDINKNYDIKLINGKGASGPKEWTPHELSLMDTVLKELPKEMLANMALTSIARSDTYISRFNIPDPDTFGVFRPSSSTIEIFDYAYTPYDFENDPKGDTQFKATILHELTHSLQYKKDEYSNYDNPYKTPLVQTYMDAMQPLNALDTGIWENGWTYFEKRGEGDWKLFSEEGNKPPTSYGNSDPTEDMSESVMMYVYNPQKLKDSSKLRYDFIRDQIFGGVEYDNGVRKTP